MGGTYVEISKAEFDSVMTAHGYSVDESLSGRENTKEYVYSKPLGKRVKLVCYSSIDQRNDGGRKVGKDAIRLVALYVDEDGKTYPINQDSRTYRVTTWKKNLERKLDDLDATPPRPFFCSKDGCGKVMRVRKRKSDGKPFLGCSGYPNCKGGRDIPTQAKPTSTPKATPAPKPSVAPTPPKPSTPQVHPEVPEGCPDQCKACVHRGGEDNTKSPKFCTQAWTHLWNAVKDSRCVNQTTSAQPRSNGNGHSGRCDECGGYGAKHDRTDSSGIPGKVCSRCSHLNSYELSFA